MNIPLHPLEVFIFTLWGEVTWYSLPEHLYDMFNPKVINFFQQMKVVKNQFAAFKIKS